MKIAEETSCRIANASLVAALAVVLLHVGIAGGTATADFPVRLYLRDFARFAVPLFFLISGYLLAGHAEEPGWWRRETAKRFKSLFIPYVAWSALFGLYLLVGVAVPEYHRTHAFDFAAWWEGKQLLLFGLDPCQAPLLLPFWYLRTLMLFILASGCLVRILRRFGSAALAVLGVFYLAYALVVEMNPVLTADGVFALLRATLSPEGLFYFAGGLWLRLRGSALPAAKRVVPVWIVATGLLLLRQVVGAWLPYPVIIPAVIYAVWSTVPAVPWPRKLTALAFPVYLVHWFFVHFLARIGPEIGTTPVTFFLSFAVIVAASAVIGLVLRRFTPRASTFLFGGR